MSVFCLVVSGTARASEDTLHFGRFGKVTLYRESPNPAHVVLFVSGDGGWNLGVVDMARALAGLDALVIGIDITHYLKQLEAADDKCSYPASDFEALSQYVQKKLDLPTYTPPVLVGYSSGATLVYAVLVQAPTNTFPGAISLGFCPDLPLTKEFCHGNGLEWTAGPKGKGYSFLPDPKLELPWVAFQGLVDQVCDPATVESYVKQVGNARLVSLEKVGHGFSVQKNWMPQFKKTFAQIVHNPDTVLAPEAGPVVDLPLVEVPAVGKDTSCFAVIISGDGGWASIDRQLGNTLAARGVPVVGVNSLKYFWKRRTPDEAGKDLERILRHYMTLWKKDKAVLIGYSRGADVLPFMANRLPEDLLAKVSLVALIGPERTVDFQFHLTDWLGNPSRKTDLPVRPEVEKLKGMKILCVYGDDETQSLCHDLDPGLATIISKKGGHHLGGDYKGLAETILSEGRD
jgi:type IV secretory pathway VirJ component